MKSNRRRSNHEGIDLLQVTNQTVTNQFNHLKTISVPYLMETEKKIFRGLAINRIRGLDGDEIRKQLILISPNSISDALMEMKSFSQMPITGDGVNGEAGS